ncbi:MAG: hypothetical protein C0401_11970 [Anaerolinea sp.]|nr:hypothetical protein [Anaerolinea sp.]
MLANTNLQGGGAGQIIEYGEKGAICGGIPGDRGYPLLPNSNDRHINIINVIDLEVSPRCFLILFDGERSICL